MRPLARYTNLARMGRVDPIQRIGGELVRNPSRPLLDAVYRLRAEAWRARAPGFPALESWHDAHDGTASHFVIVRCGAPIGAARLTLHRSLADAPDAIICADVEPRLVRGTVAVLSRLVVSPSHAGVGLSTVLDGLRIAEAARRGAQVAFVSTSVAPRVSSLMSFGFQALHTARTQAMGALQSVAPPVILMRDLLAASQHTCIGEPQ